MAMLPICRERAEADYMLYNNRLGEETPGLEIAPEISAARNQGGVESMAATEI